MCRFVFYRGPEISLASLLIDPEHSLIHQSIHAREREEPLNGDGFGIAWFTAEVPGRPVVFKEVSPAWNSLNLRSLAPASRSRCISAHVRAASPGLGVSQFNCHPFASGGLSFMHNGLVGNFLAIRRELLGRLSDRRFNDVNGTTDSELLFALLLDRLPDRPGLEDLATGIAEVIAEVEDLLDRRGSSEPSFLNLCVTDGRSSVVTRYATPGQNQCQTLYFSQGKRYVCRDGICHMEDPHSDGAAILVSSEPLNHDPGWEAVPVNSLLTIDADNNAAQRTLHTSRSLS